MPLLLKLNVSIFLCSTKASIVPMEKLLS